IFLHVYYEAEGDEKMESTAVEKQAKIFTKDFILILCANFFVFLGFQMTLPTIPIFVNELGGSDQVVGLIVGIFTFSALLFRPYAGKALETKGRATVFLFGLALFVLSVGTFGFITPMAFLVVMRIIQGIGWGFSTTAAGTIATDLLPPVRRGDGMGYFCLSCILALAFGPSLLLSLAYLLSFPLFSSSFEFFGLTVFCLAFLVTYKETVAPETQTKGGPY